MASERTTGLALQAAGRVDDLDEVRRLLAEGAAVDWADDGERIGATEVGREAGLTALLIAVRRNNEELARTLLDAGASLKAHEPSLVESAYERTKRAPKNTILHAAAKNCGAALIDLLVARGAPVDTKDEHGVTPLGIAAAAQNGPATRALLAAGADANARDRHGHSPLHLAHDATVVRALLDGGATPDPKGKEAPLPRLVREGHVVAVSLLLKAGADPHRPCAKGFSPLGLAARHGRDTIVTRLLAAGASPDDGGAGQEPPLVVAARFANEGVLQQLIEASSKEILGQALCAVCSDADPQRAKAQLGIATRLLEAGADPEHVCPQHQLTPLHLAAGAGMLSHVSLLLKSGAKPDARDAKGRTPLWLAAQAGRYEVIPTLVKSGADPLAEDTAGKTPYAASRKIKDVDRQMQVQRLLPRRKKATSAPKALKPSKGAKARHKKFGEGTISAVSGKGAKARLTIEFPEAGTKQLLASFVELLPSE